MSPLAPDPKPWKFDPKVKPQPRPDADEGFETRALHAGFDPIKDVEKFRAFVPPIVQSVTFPYESFDNHPHYRYGRKSNPTVSVLEERLASLEGGEAGLTAGSGSQALFNLILSLVEPGDNVVTTLNIFGEGYRQAVDIFPKRCGVQFRFVKNPEDPESWDQEVDKRTRLVWVETPSNPCLFVTDIRAVAEVAHARGVPLLVDNTTATAALQRPLELGADIILLSTTKFLCGNATVLGGAIVGPEALVEDVRMNFTEYIGAILQPFDAWLTLMNLETLSMRMDRHSANAQKVAECLASHPRVSRVDYPGLPTHPQYELAKRQMKSAGGMLSFVVKGGMPAAAKVMDHLQVITHAVTFGTSRSICMHPAGVTHRHLGPEERARAGIDDGLIRLSVGLESPEDIINDLERALVA